MKRRRVGASSESSVDSCASSTASDQAPKSDRVLRSSRDITTQNSLSFRKSFANEEFVSCLSKYIEDILEIFVDGSPMSRSRSSSYVMLWRALSIKELDDECWLGSSFINFVVAHFAKHYRSTHFMSVDFAVLGPLSQSNGPHLRDDSSVAFDIKGERINYHDLSRPIVFVCNTQNIHWNLIRVSRSPEPTLELFEPMGKPSSRHGGLSFRQVPRQGTLTTYTHTACNQTNKPKLIIYIILRIQQNSPNYSLCWQLIRWHFSAFHYKLNSVSLSYHSNFLVRRLLPAFQRKIMALRRPQRNIETTAIHEFWLWCRLPTVCRKVWSRTGMRNFETTQRR
jgi:hypothetical protein